MKKERYNNKKQKIAILFITFIALSSIPLSLMMFHSYLPVGVDKAIEDSVETQGIVEDEYTIQWFKDDAPVTSGITVPTIQVIKRSDGTDLVASQTPTQIGSSGAYKWDESSNRITNGEAVLVVVGATIDGSARAWRVPLGRDASS